MQHFPASVPLVPQSSDSLHGQDILRCRSHTLAWASLRVQTPPTHGSANFLQSSKAPLSWLVVVVPLEGLCLADWGGRQEKRWQLKLAGCSACLQANCCPGMCLRGAVGCEGDGYTAVSPSRLSSQQAWSRTLCALTETSQHFQPRYLSQVCLPSGFTTFFG